MGFLFTKPLATFAAEIEKEDLKNKFMASKKITTTLILCVFCAALAFAQHGNAQNPTTEAPAEEYNAGETAIHHISDANTIEIWGSPIYLNFPLPCFLYAPGEGLTTTMSSVFHPHHHGDGEMSYKNYVMKGGSVLRVTDPGFPKEGVEIQGFTTKKEKSASGKEVEVFYAKHDGKEFRCDKKTTWDGGLMGGGTTSFYDYSITRNVFTMLLTCLILFLAFRSAARAYKKREGMAPKGLQSFLEPLVTFIRDDVAKPSIGPKYEKYMPYLLSAFFFILGLNLIGQIPFFPGSANVTGNISVTIVMALITFALTLGSSNKHFWEHTLWMPGIPAVLKVLILTPVEILGLFLKPFTLLLRLFANITAGHIVIACFVSLIFIFGKAGANPVGAYSGVLAAVPLTLFMMALELLVAFLQAFIFTMLSATYIGMALEEPHGDHH